MADLIERASAINALQYVVDSPNYSKALGEILRIPTADTPQTETHDLRTETHECVDQTDCPWR